MNKLENKRNKIYICLSIILAAAIIVVCYMGQKKQGKEVARYSQLASESNKQNKRSQPPLEDQKEGAAKQEEKKVEKPKYEGTLKYNDKSIPVLMYHSAEYLEAEPKNELRVPKEKFREQMKFLKDNGYSTLSMDELYQFFANNVPIPEKSVVITFDDGYLDNYTNALPVIKEYGLKATVFVVTDWVNTNNSYMNTEQLKEMDANGFEIQSHTLDHKELDKLTADEQLRTLKESKQFLEEKLNKKITTIAYPIGKFSDNTLKAAKEAGYLMGIKMVGGIANKNNGLLTINRIYIKASDTIQQFEAKIKQ